MQVADIYCGDRAVIDIVVRITATAPTGNTTCITRSRLCERPIGPIWGQAMLGTFLHGDATPESVHAFPATTEALSVHRIVPPDAGPELAHCSVMRLTTLSSRESLRRAATRPAGRTFAAPKTEDRVAHPIVALACLLPHASVVLEM